MRTVKEVLNEQGDWRDNGEHEIIAAMDKYADSKLEIAALREISEGKGVYSRDPLTHNVIKESKALAVDALKEMGYE